MVHDNNNEHHFITDDHNLTDIVLINHDDDDDNNENVNKPLIQQHTIELDDALNINHDISTYSIQYTQIVNENENENENDTTELEEVKMVNDNTKEDISVDQSSINTNSTSTSTTTVNIHDSSLDTNTNNHTESCLLITVNDLLNNNTENVRMSPVTTPRIRKSKHKTRNIDIGLKDGINEMNELRSSQGEFKIPHPSDDESDERTEEKLSCTIQSKVPSIVNQFNERDNDLNRLKITTVTGDLTINNSNTHSYSIDKKLEHTNNDDDHHYNSNSSQQISNTIHDITEINSQENDSNQIITDSLTIFPSLTTNTDPSSQEMTESNNEHFLDTNKHNDMEITSLKLNHINNNQITENDSLRNGDNDTNTLIKDSNDTDINPSLIIQQDKEDEERHNEKFVNISSLQRKPTREQMIKTLVTRTVNELSIDKSSDTETDTMRNIALDLTIILYFIMAISSQINELEKINDSLPKSSKTNESNINTTETTSTNPNINQLNNDGIEGKKEKKKMLQYRNNNIIQELRVVYGYYLRILCGELQ